jgi:hypothetical protein
MSDNKISQYTATTTLANADLFDVSIDLGAGLFGTRKITYANLLSEIAADAGLMGGSGTSGYIPRFTGSTTLGAGAMRDDGTSIGLGTAVLSSALFAMVSTTKGFLPPSMTTTQKNAIGTPATGLFLFDNTLAMPAYYNGSTWKSISTIGSEDQTITDDVRNLALKGNSLTEKFFINSLAGTNIFGVRGDQKIALFTSTFGSSDLSIGAASAGKKVQHFVDPASSGNFILSLSTTSATVFEYDAYQRSLTLTNTVDYNTSTTMNGRLISTSSPNTLFTGKTVAGTTIISMDSRGDFVIFDSTGVTPRFIAANGDDYLYNIMKKPLLLGGDYGSITASTMLNVRDSGSTSGTTTLLVENSSLAQSLKILGDGKIGLYTATPVAQHSSTGYTAGFTAGAGTAMNNDSTSTGGVGSTAYTFGDVVKMAKNIGLMAA